MLLIEVNAVLESYLVPLHVHKEDTKQNFVQEKKTMIIFFGDFWRDSIETWKTRTNKFTNLWLETIHQTLFLSL